MTDFQVVSLDIAQLREMMRTDCATYLAFYLEDEITLEIPELHEEIWDEMVAMVRAVNLPTFTGHLQKLFCVPRGHAKSTITKLAVILFLRYSYMSFALYVSSTSGIAVNAVKDIVSWLTSDKERQVYGPVHVHQANESKQIWTLTISTPDFGEKYIILKALGSDQQVRGLLIDNKRPEIIVMDDCEDNDTAATPATQQKLDVWVLGNLLKASARRSIRIMLGNMIKSTTLLARLSKNPDWKPTVYGAIVRDKVTKELKPLWPGLYTVDGLMKEWADYRALGTGHVWVYEMMNMTADSVFKTTMDSAERTPRPNPDQIESGIITLDPAFGEKAYHDESAITVHVRIKGSGIPWIVETRHGRWKEEEILDNLISLSYYWNLSTWGIESASAQKLLIPLFRAFLKDRLIPPQLFTMIPLPNGGTAKSSRIIALCNAVGEGSYGIVDEEEELVQLLGTYDPSSKSPDDRCDSAAYGPIAWAQAGAMIQDAGTIKEMFALLQNGQIEGNVHQSDLVPY